MPLQNWVPWPQRSPLYSAEVLKSSRLVHILSSIGVFASCLRNTTMSSYRSKNATFTATALRVYMSCLYWIQALEYLPNALYEWLHSGLSPMLRSTQCNVCEVNSSTCWTLNAFGGHIPGCHWSDQPTADLWCLKQCKFVSKVEETVDVMEAVPSYAPMER